MRRVGVAGDPNLEAVQAAAAALGGLLDSVVLVGGCATGLLLTSIRSEMIRPTRDIDLVVEAVSPRAYRGVERELRSLGFVNDQSEDAPICRWRKDELIVDLMPTDERVFGFGNRWYPMAAETAEPVALPNGQVIRLTSAPVFLATKLDAFKDRGGGDFFASHDLEDVITVIDGREELAAETRAAPAAVRDALAGQLTELVANPDFNDALAGMLPGDLGSQARLPGLYERLAELASGQVAA